MDERLAKIARLGDVVALNALLKEDPFILEKVDLAPVAETPLHIAVLAGKTDFVKEMLKRMPSFAQELNQDGFTPMHMASARGNIDIVRELLMLGKDHLCLLKDKGARTPLHCAAIKGRVEIIKELLDNSCHQAVHEVTTRGETVLHLVVKNNQFEALRVFVDWLKRNGGLEELLNAEDKGGNTISELAKATKQLQVIDLLSELQKEETLEIVSTDAGDSGIDIVTQEEICMSTQEKYEQAENKLEQRDKNKRNYEKLILVVASLIATVTFQAGVTPPQSIWKDGLEGDWDICMSNPVTSLEDFINVMKTCRVISYIIFMICNTTGFSCAIFFLGLSLTNPVLVKLLLILSLGSMFLAYVTLSITMVPNDVAFIIIYVTTFFLFVYYVFIPFIFNYIATKLSKLCPSKLSSLVSHKFGSSPADVSNTDAQVAP